MHGWHVVVIQLSSNFLELSHKYLAVHDISASTQRLSHNPSHEPGGSRDAGPFYFGSRLIIGVLGFTYEKLITIYSIQHLLQLFQLIPLEIFHASLTLINFIHWDVMLRMDDLPGAFDLIALSSTPVHDTQWPYKGSSWTLLPQVFTSRYFC